jgi:hypothetical protein
MLSNLAGVQSDDGNVHMFVYDIKNIIIKMDRLKDDLEDSNTADIIENTILKPYTFTTIA